MATGIGPVAQEWQGNVAKTMVETSSVDAPCPRRPRRVALEAGLDPPPPEFKDLIASPPPSMVSTIAEYGRVSLRPLRRTQILSLLSRPTFRAINKNQSPCIQPVQFKVFLNARCAWLVGTKC